MYEISQTLQTVKKHLPDFPAFWNEVHAEFKGGTVHEKLGLIALGGATAIGSVANFGVGLEAGSFPILVSPEGNLARQAMLSLGALALSQLYGRTAAAAGNLFREKADASSEQLAAPDVGPEPANVPMEQSRVHWINAAINRFLEANALGSHTAALKRFAGSRSISKLGLAWHASVDTGIVVGTNVGVNSLVASLDGWTKNTIYAPAEHAVANVLTFPFLYALLCLGKPHAENLAHKAASARWLGSLAMKQHTTNRLVRPVRKYGRTVTARLRRSA